MTFTSTSDPFLAAELAYHRERLIRDVARARAASRRRRGVTRVLHERRQHVGRTGGDAPTDL